MPRELWQKCMDILQDELPSQQFNTWLRPLKVMADQDELCLLAPNRFVLDWVKDKYLPRIEEIFMEFSDGNPPAIALGVSNRRPSFGIRSSGRSGSSCRRPAKGAAATGFSASAEALSPSGSVGTTMFSGSFNFDEEKGQTNLDLYSQGSTSSGKAEEEDRFDLGRDVDLDDDKIASKPFEGLLESTITEPEDDNSGNIGAPVDPPMVADTDDATTAAANKPVNRFVNPLKNKHSPSVKTEPTTTVTNSLTVEGGSSLIAGTMLGCEVASEEIVETAEGVVTEDEEPDSDSGDSVLFSELEAESEQDAEHSGFDYSASTGFTGYDLQGESHHELDDDREEQLGAGVIMPTGAEVEVEGSTRHSNSLNRAFVFESFVEGKSNQLALAAATQVAENPGNAYNPLFLYGGVGLGKTHLMHAIGNRLARQNPDAKIIYLHSERFVADMVKALQLNAINDFKRYYRSVDALLIDDIQFFAGKERSQEEFFHTFNALLEGGQQMILTCDRYPKEIGGLEERLKSRFGWGLTVAVEPPELETRVAILMKKAEQARIELPHESAFFIAQRIRSNVRELEGALKRVIANAHFMGRKIDINLIRESLKDLLALQDKQISIENIQRLVAEFYKIKVSEIVSKRRIRAFARPRQIAMALSKELTTHSLPEIGNAYGGRDHTTVLHACRKVQELCRDDAELEKDYKHLLSLLTN